MKLRNLIIGLVALGLFSFGFATLMPSKEVQVAGKKKSREIYKEEADRKTSKRTKFALNSSVNVNRLLLLSNRTEVAGK